MLIIVGLIIVVLSVLGGYVGAHGKMAALWQPFELVIIGGAALGAFLVGTPAKTVKATLASVPAVFKGPEIPEPGLPGRTQPGLRTAQQGPPRGLHGA